MRLVPLTLDYELTEFNCGDEQLNNFLYEDAKPSLELRIAKFFDKRSAKAMTLIRKSQQNEEIRN